MNARAHAPRILAVVRSGSVGGLPYAGTFRLIDVPLSNLRNAGMGDVLIWEQDGASTEDVSEAIRRHRADAVLLLGVGSVYRLDYAEVVAEHLRRGADCTVVTAEVTDAGEAPSTAVATDVLVYRPEVLVE